MSHTYHDALEGFDARQILHDGCHECEARGTDLQSALAHMDGPTFARAWKRAFDLNTGAEATGRISQAESNLLSVLFAIQVEFEHRGLPFDGKLPEPA